MLISGAHCSPDRLMISSTKRSCRSISDYAEIYRKSLDLGLIARVILIVPEKSKQAKCLTGYVTPWEDSYVRRSQTCKDRCIGNKSGVGGHQTIYAMSKTIFCLISFFICDQTNRQYIYSVKDTVITLAHCCYNVNDMHNLNKKSPWILKH